MNPIFLLLSFALVATLMIIEGMRGRTRSTTLQKFFLMGEGLKFKPFVGTLAATNFSLGNMIFLCLIWGYFYGLGGMVWLLIGFIAAAFVYIRFVQSSPEVQQYIENRTNSGSVHEYLGLAFASNGTPETTRMIRLLASLTTVLCVLVALTLELYLASQLLSPLVSIDTTTLFIILTSLICAYSALGGFWAVVKTDILQGALLIAGLISFFCIKNMLGLQVEPYSSRYVVGIIPSLMAPGWLGIVSIIGVTFAWYLVTMDTWQRSSASRSAGTATSGMVGGTVVLIVGIVIFSLIGMYDALAIKPSLVPDLAGMHSGGINPITDLGLLQAGLSAWGKALYAFFVGTLVMAALSTADTFLVVAGHSFVSDLLIGVGKHSSFSELSEVENILFTGIARAVIVGMGVFVVATFFLLDSLGLLSDPLGLFYLAYSIQFALFAPVILSIRKRKPQALAILWGLAFAIITAVVWGFGFSLASKWGIESVLGFATAELVYLAPLPPILTGLIVTSLLTTFLPKTSGRAQE